MRKYLVAAILICLCSCAAPETEKAESKPAYGGEREFAPKCGVVSSGVLKPSVTTEEGIPVRVTGVAGNNRLAVRLPDGGSLLVKLQGLGNGPDRLQTQAMNSLESISGGQLFLYSAGDSCNVTVPGGGQGIVGQLLTMEGMSLSEAMASSGLVEVTTDEPCASAQYSACLAGLYETQPVTAGELSRFLWKPESDSDGNLAIHTGPYGTEVVVNGETGRNQGSGNGYGSLARFSRPGCGYPAPRIQVIDGYSGLPYTIGGKTSFTVGNPCGRHCLRDGAIEPCTK